MTISESKRGSVTILQASGKLDAASAPEMDRRIAAFIEGGARQVVLDLAGVDYISSAGLRVLLTAAKSLQKVRGKLVLAAPSHQARQILDMAGFPAIVPVTDTIDQACASFALPAAESARASVAPPSEPVRSVRSPLSFAEELYLLALDDTRGLLKPLPASAFDYALAGALLMELALDGRIDTDLNSLKVTSAEPTGDPLLDDTLRELAQKKEPQATAFWLSHFAEQAGRTEKRVLASLIQKGVLKQENRRILWVFEVRRYPLMDDREVKEVRARLRDLMLGEEIPDPRDIVLISLGNVCRLLDDLFGAAERGHVQSRIDALARLDLIGREMARSIREIESAMTMAMMATPGFPAVSLGGLPFGGVGGDIGRSVY